MTPAFWRGKRVFVTGHTGFKGGWLSLWLSSLGAQVHGYALAPPTQPSFFEACRLREHLAGHTIADVRDAAALSGALQQARPDVVFHMAAQPLVRHSYAQPVETFEVNVMGTVNLLQAVRALPGTVRGVVNVTTDKCYENHGYDHAYREDAPLGGHDPYSASKACSELVAAAYRRSFLAAAGVRVASARAGNVIGGGDWAADRLVPDFLRALDAGETLVIRAPHATRPWQHVLEPVSGYMALAEALHAGDGDTAATAWNFGPGAADAKPVQWIVETLCTKTPGAKWRTDAAAQPHEAHYLKLDSSAARERLGWRSRWHIAAALDRTLDWHTAWKHGAGMAQASLEQIADYAAA